MKGVEMQIAVPRTTEATNVQNQLNQKPGYDQASLANQTAKRAERERTQAVRADGADFLNVREDGGGARSGAREGNARRRKADDDERRGAAEPGHPFKGRHIDISL